MHTHYKVRVLNHSAITVYETDDFNSLSYDKSINGVSSHVITFPNNTSQDVGQYFGTDYIVQVWRDDIHEGMQPYVDYEGFHRTPQYDTSDQGRKIFTSYGRSFEDLVQRRSIAYKATEARATKTALSGETAIKQFVNENAGPGALVSQGRIVDGVTPGLVIEPTSGYGTAWTGSVQYQNLLDVIKNIAATTGVYFRVIRSGTTFTFQVMPTSGANRTQGTAQPVVFAEEFGNMISPTYVLSKTEEVNRIIVLGQGQDAARTTVVRNDIAAQQESPWALIEKTHDARNSSTLDALNNEGDQELLNLQAKENFTFTVLQADASRYGVHYFHGDIVTARMGTIQRDKSIISTSVRMAEGKEELKFNFSDTIVDPDPMRQILLNLNRRLRSIELRGNL